jgi:protein involved in polysaccharide export with SLBB domain
MKFFRSVLALVVTAGLFPACSLVKQVKIPFITSGTAAPNDPLVAYDVRKPLAYGHTLELSVYRGVRSPSRIFNERVMVDGKGYVHLGKVGDVKVGGLTTTQAIRSIEAAFRHYDGSGIVSVRLSRIEETPLVLVTGAVRYPGVIQFFDGITATSALPYVGGRSARAPGLAVYVTREGVRTFHTSGAGVELLPGDIVEFSSDL